MVVMVLDHTRDFVHAPALQFIDPTDLARTSVAIFFTRWITHYCAPVFVFLAGVGAYLQFARGKSRRELSTFLLTRGLWLIFLECTAVKIGGFFTFDYRFFGFFQVIWAIGVSMIVLAALIHLPLKVVGGFGVAMIALHNLLDRFKVAPWQGPQSPVPGVGAKLWIVLHQQGAFPIAGFPSPLVIVVYPLIPWIGVMAAGYAFGSVYQMAAERRRKLLLIMGSVLTVLFAVIRAINIFGDPARWSTQKSATFTVLSFLNTTKYPPSLLFLLMTLGPAMILLARFELLKGGWRKPFITFGRVPLFFYLLQWPIAHGISVLLHWLAGKPVRPLLISPLDAFGSPIPATMGFSLAVVYVAWLAAILLLYPLCKWFAGVKKRRRDWWLSYL